MLVIENEDIDAIKEAKSEYIKFLKTPHPIRNIVISSPISSPSTGPFTEDMEESSNGLFIDIRQFLNSIKTHAPPKYSEYSQYFQFKWRRRCASAVNFWKPIFNADDFNNFQE